MAPISVQNGEPDMAGKTNRKHKRNDAFCKKYKLECREAKNKDHKLTRHLLAHPNDKQAETGQPPKSYTRKKPLDAFERLFLRDKK